MVTYAAEGCCSPSLSRAQLFCRQAIIRRRWGTRKVRDVVAERVLWQAEMQHVEELSHIRSLNPRCSAATGWQSMPFFLSFLFPSVKNSNELDQTDGEPHVKVRTRIHRRRNL
jgi:hypothetical protein